MPIEDASYRELYRTFATKDDVLQIKESLQSLHTKLDFIIPRDTHEQVWKQDEKWREQIRSDIKELRGDTEDLKRERTPTRIFTAVFTVFGWIVAFLIAYFHPGRN